MNSEKLAKMGVDETVNEFFINNAIFTPRQQTLLVAALEELDGVKGRGDFVKFAVLTSDQDVAFFRQRMAQMYAAYHRRVAPIDRFVSLGRETPIRNLSVVRTKSGIVMFHAPLDYLIWTESMARIFWAMDQAVGAMPGVAGKELWLAGFVSPMARQNIEKAGWRIHANKEHELLLIQ